jgi:deoxyribodipyrimidine photo-lyase
MTASIHIVWFKRDLRVQDHLPLLQACNAGSVLPLFAWEPAVWAGDDYAAQHQAFITECLAELTTDLANLGLTLLQSNIGMLQTLVAIRKTQPIAAIYSHEETGNGATFTVDKAVAAWCKLHGVDWVETPQNGVVRGLKNRNYWNAHWEQRMNAPLVGMPCKPISMRPAEHVFLHGINSVVNSHVKIVPFGTDKPRRQRGGRSHGLEIFNSFLDGRAAKFRGGISSPLSAVTAGSRLSPYLAYGCLSMREVVQATRDRRTWAAEVPHMFPKSLNAGLVGFESRLHWHCHFMQKLESEPEMEFENLHHAHDDMRDEQLSDVESQRRLQAWSKGETGWPLVDACMAMLRETGWVNFRMRAMLMSTSSYLYWLHWRQSGLHLAREFLDYEPGIHWSQSQMQSGTTGINTLRIYSPIKQAQDQDPTGAFVRHWLPALKQVPDSWIFEPYLMPKAQQLQYGCELDKHYPVPLINIAQATREARAKISAARKKDGVYDETLAVIKKHASRKGMAGSGRNKNGQQLVQKKSQKKSTLMSIKSIQQELF